jgi:para-nitrobenzyl esterase
MIFLFFSCSTDKAVDTGVSPTVEEQVEEVACTSDNPTIDSSTGCVVGLQQGTLSYFLGIPYAEPPIGSLRWKRTVPHANWDEPFAANNLSAFCTQFTESGIIGSEDCLTLNIFRPKTLPEEPLPIMFYTHGGSYIAGAGSSDVFNAPPMLAEKAIVVTHNYRLGAFGFLAHELLSEEDAIESGGLGSSGNVGLFDTRTALQWVYDNAEELGGSQDQIMIFGESAGAITTCTLLMNPESEGLFSSALIQSGGCNVISVPLSQAQGQGEYYEESIGCADEENRLECMRSATKETIMAVDLTQTQYGSGFAPNVDEDFIPEATGTMLYYGNFHRVPIAAGINGNEGSMFVHAMGLTEEEELEQVVREYGTAYGISDLDTLLSLYSSEEHGGVQAAMDQLHGDMFFVCPTRLSMDMISFYLPSYAYYYTHEPSWIASYPSLEGWGAYHSSELNFIFGTYLSYLTPDEKLFAEQMMNTWVNFARGEYSTEGAGAWEVYGTDTSSQVDGGQWLSLNPTGFDMMSGVHKDRCDFIIQQWFQ